MNNIRYEVWALNYDKENCAVDGEEFLGTFLVPETALTYAKTFNSILDVYPQDIIDDYMHEGDYIEIRVEKVEINSEAHTSTCIELLYTQSLYQTGENK